VIETGPVSLETQPLHPLGFTGGGLFGSRKTEIPEASKTRPVFPNATGVRLKLVGAPLLGINLKPLSALKATARYRTYLLVIGPFVVVLLLALAII
jgi:hypothetical protein